MSGIRRKAALTLALNGTVGIAICYSGARLSGKAGKANMSGQLDFFIQLNRFEDRLPVRIARASRYLRRPEARAYRMPSAVLLTLGGMAGFLPILGFWMLPLGLLLLAVDVPRLRNPMARLLDWIERRWPPRKPAA